ncbi:MAG TPA: PH domain-containing protein [Longimicrobiaceae bacterium]|nr:PH domain-containing protein [Longimicrobiaceae bacterium]
MTDSDPIAPAGDLPAPPGRDAPLQRLDPRMVRVWQASSAVTTLVFGGLVAAVVLLAGLSPWWILPLPLLGLLATALWPPRRYRHWGYRVGEVDVRVMRGALWRTVSVVLHSRIQHVDTRQGPIARMFGLASVVVFTAGHVGAVVEIPGLAQADAEALRDRLAALSGTDDAV